MAVPEENTTSIIRRYAPLNTQLKGRLETKCYAIPEEYHTMYVAVQKQMEMKWGKIDKHSRMSMSMYSNRSK